MMDVTEINDDDNDAEDSSVSSLFGSWLIP